ncbi:polyphosphate kinase 2 family protein [Dialister sp.]|uniref:polyphosphate kinase 2 family protein n=1 Tax=Dialister sp. TaxID=1955814 RepID=UPI002E7FEB99|nr:polyphosphate kinase 2 family protein [Dialister sp.]MEE3453501.1 polyphosphate kinase 2 family protein [Dialister sp.]
MEEITDGKIDIDRYRVKEGAKVNLKKCPTGCDVEIDKARVKSLYFPETIEKMKDLQEKLYAQNTYGLIIVLQAMDAAGKDGTVNHVFSNLDPGGVKVVSFKQPTTEEKDHDYMWRINKALPGRGDIGIFNRSQYEDVIVTRIHDLIDKGQLPKDLIDENIWEERYEQINNWEKYLHQNGFRMIKIFLHVSKEEQQKRLMDRIVNQQKNWKFSLSDINERQYWDQYQRLYEEMIARTSKDISPWYIVPADNKWYTRYVVARITLKALKDINPQFPKLAPEVAEQLERFKKLISTVDLKSLEEIQGAISAKK